MRLIDKLIEEVVKENPNNKLEKEEIVLVANMYLQTFVEFEKLFLNELKDEYKLKAENYKKENNILGENIFSAIGDSMEILKNKVEEHYKIFIKEQEG